MPMKKVQQLYNCILAEPPLETTSDFYATWMSAVQQATITFTVPLNFTTELLNIIEDTGTWSYNTGTDELTIPSAGDYRVIIWGNDRYSTNRDSSCSKYFYQDDGGGFVLTSITDGLASTFSNHGIPNGTVYTNGDYEGEDIMSFTTAGKIKVGLARQWDTSSTNPTTQGSMAVLRVPMRALGVYQSSGTGATVGGTVYPDAMSTVDLEETPGFTVSSGEITITESGVYRFRWHIRGWTNTARDLCTLTIEENTGGGYADISEAVSQCRWNNGFSYGAQVYKNGMSTQVIKEFTAGDTVRVKFISVNVIYEAIEFQAMRLT